MLLKNGPAPFIIPLRATGTNRKFSALVSHKPLALGTRGRPMEEILQSADADWWPIFLKMPSADADGKPIFLQHPSADADADADYFLVILKTVTPAFRL